MKITMNKKSNLSLLLVMSVLMLTACKNGDSINNTAVSEPAAASTNPTPPENEPLFFCSFINTLLANSYNTIIILQTYSYSILIMYN